MSVELMRRYVCCLVWGTLMIAGCTEDGPTRVEVTGAVAMDGEPVEEGQILFVPADGQGPSDACDIAGGKFTCSLTPGKKHVEITATREIPATTPEGMPDAVDLIPACYNSESTLTADVNASGETNLVFDLNSAANGQ